jgi:hypothetical protein
MPPPLARDPRPRRITNEMRGINRVVDDITSNHRHDRVEVGGGV